MSCFRQQNITLFTAKHRALNIEYGLARLRQHDGFPYVRCKKYQPETQKIRQEQMR
ncbi:hypothetical protein DAQ1742_02130 [Dickeya aquatica]|uniref:Uncharacterized protein n=1 Tax=Dickeya aquatica TaxID=1401087 RepID=A0A375AAR6_9GAMM|nr:hypothetical protein DAQ1742_02130 [Dickeya aquatica]